MYSSCLQWNPALTLPAPFSSLQTMTSESSPIKSADVHQRLEALIRVVQDSKQCRIITPGKVWWVIKHNKKSQQRFSEAFSFVEQLDVSPKSFEDAFGRKFFDVLESNPFLHCEVAAGCNVVTILDSDEHGNPVPIPKGAPDASRIITYTSMGPATKLLKRKVLSYLNEPATVTSTPISTRGGTKRPAVSVTPMTTTGNDSDPSGKRLRQGDKTKESPLHADINVQINVFVNESGINLESLANHVVEKLLDEARKQTFKPSTNLQTLAYLTLKCNTDKEGIASLNSVDSMGRNYLYQYIAVPKSIKKMAELDGNQVIKRKAKMLGHALNEQNDQQVAILTELAKGKGFKLIKQEERILDVKEVIALRDFARTSQNGVMRIEQFLRHRLDLHIFPSNFMRRVVEYESKNDTSLAITQIPLYVSKKEVSKEYCTFFHVKDPFSVLESLIIRTIMDGSFEESFTFSALHRKLVVVFGGDRGGDAFSMLIRVANRANGNAARYCQLLGLFERGAECYENLRDTIFSLMFPIRSFLQLLLDDKLVAVIVTVETDEGVKQCTTVLIQLSDLERRSEFVPENVKFTLSADDIANDDGTALPE